MARKVRRARTSNMSTFRAVGEGAATVLDTFVSGFFGRVREEADVVMTRVEERVMVMRAELMRLTFASILIGIGVLIILAAGLMYLVQGLGMRWPTALLITGVVMVVLAYIIRMGRTW